jgi:hypothetical protein
MRTLIAVSTAAFALSVAVLPAMTASAVDTPPQTGCPASNEVLSVADLTPLGYRLPGRLDAAGNANGLICAKLLAPAADVQACLHNPECVPGTVLYYFRDDTLVP